MTIIDLFEKLCALSKYKRATVQIEIYNGELIIFAKCVINGEVYAMRKATLPGEDGQAYAEILNAIQDRANYIESQKNDH